MQSKKKILFFLSRTAQYVTLFLINSTIKDKDRSVCACAGPRLCLLVDHTMSPHPSDQLSERSPVSTTALNCSALIADIYISISTGTFDIENIKYEKKWQQLDLDTNFEP